MIALSIHQAQAVHWWYLLTSFVLLTITSFYWWADDIANMTLTFIIEWYLVHWTGVAQVQISTFNLNFKCASSTSLLVLVFPPPPPNKQSVCFYQLPNCQYHPLSFNGLRHQRKKSNRDLIKPALCKKGLQKALDWLWRCMICVREGGKILRQTSKQTKVEDNET